MDVRARTVDRGPVYVVKLRRSRVTPSESLYLYRSSSQPVEPKVKQDSDQTRVRDLGYEKPRHTVEGSGCIKSRKEWTRASPCHGVEVPS